MNRLQFESSPYLLQHASNPVDWYPWGQEAFEAAKKLDRPILLSIGYSTCHWCHVMEHESFEDLEIAEFMNANYISIKVDREERPDIDAIYMSAVQATTGHGGWPMSVWLTPDKKPFYAGTYFPPRAGARGASFGFLEILKHLKQKFDESPDEVAHHAAQIAQVVRESLEPSGKSSQVSGKVFESAVAFYKSRFDSEHGGLVGQPKFPSSFPIRTLLRWHAANPSPELLEMISTTLRCMARGGIYDQVAGGFHRYSTDAEWLVPHFEKMLYDNALLARAYVEAFQALCSIPPLEKGAGGFSQEFKTIAHEIFAYIEREMTSPEGVFYSATDADSQGPGGETEEGYFFTWTIDELQQLLSPAELQLCVSHYNICDEGNFEGRNIPFVNRNFPDLPSHAELSAIKSKLLAARNKRPLPLRDEKILTAWNALMISALAKGAVVLDSPEYLERASRAATFILEHMYTGGQLYRIYKDSKTKQPAFLDDYAFLIAALLDLYEASTELKWLEHAIALERVLHSEFEDPQHGGYFMTSGSHEELIAREKPAYDGAEPSGNSVQCLNLFRLYQLTMQEDYREQGEKCLTAFSHALERSPMSLSEMLIALNFSRARHQEIIIVTLDNEKHLAKPSINVLRTRFTPNAFMLVLTEDEARAQKHLVPALEGKIAINGAATLYVCEDGACQLPETDPARVLNWTFL